jgi:hypothetical protein
MSLSSKRKFEWLDISEGESPFGNRIRIPAPLESKTIFGPH